MGAANATVRAAPWLHSNQEDRGRRKAARTLQRAHGSREERRKSCGRAEGKERSRRVCEDAGTRADDGGTRRRKDGFEDVKARPRTISGTRESVVRMSVRVRIVHRHFAEVRLCWRETGPQRAQAKSARGSSGQVRSGARRLLHGRADKWQRMRRNYREDVGRGRQVMAGPGVGVEACVERPSE